MLEAGINIYIIKWHDLFLGNPMTLKLFDCLSLGKVTTTMPKTEVRVSIYKIVGRKGRGRGWKRQKY